MGKWERVYCDGKHPRLDRDVYDVLPNNVSNILDALSRECDDLVQIVHEGMSMLIDRMEEKDGPVDVTDIPDAFVETCYMLTEHINRLKKADVGMNMNNTCHIKWKDSRYINNYIINETESMRKKCLLRNK
ncbi:MAG: hypothetical protein WCC17_08525 [Candidatus Nitrosopolaris sp.]